MTLVFARDLSYSYLTQRRDFTLESLHTNIPMGNCLGKSLKEKPVENQLARGRLERSVLFDFPNQGLPFEGVWLFAPKPYATVFLYPLQIWDITSSCLLVRDKFDEESLLNWCSQTLS